MRKPILSSIRVALLVASSAFAARYAGVFTNTNYTTWNQTTVPYISALDLASNKVFLAQSPRYFTVDSSAKDTYAGDKFAAAYPIYWLDISRGITEKHKALGFIDVMVSTVISDTAGVSGWGRSYTNAWRMLGDSDKRDDNDYRAMCDGVVYEMTDFRYKASQSRRGKTYDDTSLQIFYSNQNAHGYYGLSGDYGILRFAVPKKTFGDYSLFLGKGNIQSINTRGEPTEATVSNFWHYLYVDDDTGNSHGSSYQVFLYTPLLSNLLIPVVAIKSPASMPSTFYEYSVPDRLAYTVTATKASRIPAGVPVTFTAKDSYKSNVTISKWEWSFDAGNTWLESGEETTYTFATNGYYPVYLRMTGNYVGTTIVASNVGSFTETSIANTGNAAWTNTNTSQLDCSPTALPFFVSVENPPAMITMPDPRPNPFIPNRHGQVLLDFTLSQDVAVTVNILNMRGDLVKNLITSEKKYPAGFWTAVWDGRDSKGILVQDGIYYGVLLSGDTKIINKIHLVRVD